MNIVAGDFLVIFIRCLIRHNVYCAKYGKHSISVCAPAE